MINRGRGRSPAPLAPGRSPGTTRRGGSPHRAVSCRAAGRCRARRRGGKLRHGAHRAAGPRSAGLGICRGYNEHLCACKRLPPGTGRGHREGHRHHRGPGGRGTPAPPSPPPPGTGHGPVFAPSGSPARAPRGWAGGRGGAGEGRGGSAAGGRKRNRRGRFGEARRGGSVPQSPGAAAGPRAGNGQRGRARGEAPVRAGGTFGRETGRRGPADVPGTGRSRSRRPVPPGGEKILELFGHGGRINGAGGIAGRRIPAGTRHRRVAAPRRPQRPGGGGGGRRPAQRGRRLGPGPPYLPCIV